MVVVWLRLRLLRGWRHCDREDDGGPRRASVGEGVYQRRSQWAAGYATAVMAAIMAIAGRGMFVLCSRVGREDK